MYRPKIKSASDFIGIQGNVSRQRSVAFLCMNILCLFASFPLWGQSAEKHLSGFRTIFWNVENLFDTHPDTLKNDEEFLPEGIRRWHFKRYRKKLDDIARTLVAAGEWEPPVLVGLCEVENDKVLLDLTLRSPLKEIGYRYVMTSSADVRGIDVALLYRRDRFKLLSYRAVEIPPLRDYPPTRDVLHVCGLLPTKDTLDVLVCHFPSRSRGFKESEPYRLHAAQMVRAQTDSLLKHRSAPRLLVMGDFNDYPTNRSLREVLRVEAPPDSPSVEKCYHLLARKARSSDYGTYKLKGGWGLLDHLMVSGLLLDKRSSFYTDEASAGVLRLPFLLKEDDKYGGTKPHRTYNGMMYEGGVSDHLPLYVDFYFRLDEPE